MANPEESADDGNRLIPIADQTPAELEATRLHLQARKEELAEQQAMLARQREEHHRPYAGDENDMEMLCRQYSARRRQRRRRRRSA